MKLFHIFKDCLLLPQKDAMLRLNRLQMKNTFLYYFVLLLILIIPLELTVLQKNTTGPNDFYITQVLILYPFFMIFYALIGISLLTFLTVLMGKALKRKLKFQLLWKMIAFTLTKPILVFVFAYIMLGNQIIVNVIVMLLTFISILRLILAYPKKKL
ncbi:hypothetical protein [Robertmurraya massiliosenegalensis]|uniref:hypothetical protein n=1 Tax=Robertmurraya massiliosenegalensis TaxID=1287657 RepID=UPI00031FCAC1|nr:hypothetical protein [Robertmurraya massiliosenegalensis]